MLESVFSPLYNSGSELNVPLFLLIMASALLLGALEAAVYRKTGPCSRSFAVTLAVLPAVVSVIILMVSGSIGAGVAGSFLLARFRSAREIAAVFTAMAVGLACGMDCPALVALFTLILSAAELFYSRIGFGEEDGSLQKTLHVTLPESLEYSGIFDDLFSEYTTGAKLTRVKTTNPGRLNRLSYDLTLRAPGSEKALIDAIRCRNGNPEVSLCCRAVESGEL